MGSEYDRKFEEMKKYIPFLESMITRLESNNSSSSNPRQAQLDKIRSLRDLLLDKKKRMKMDNLLKCEQVLVNLYAKVEQKDTLPAVKIEKMDHRTSDSSNLEAVRTKLKNVVKLKTVTDTLPEIARASEIEEICEPGSKEPALFQRRPNRSSLSPNKQSPRKAYDSKVSPKSQSKRYTRVLVSPEPRSRWSSTEESSSEKLLFSRRSPRSPKRITPTYHRKERKKASKSKEGKSRKDLNITLKVPEESLHSLNTDDILSRIITCSDGDVDIDTLRELRSQILGELKQTGTNDDISELILKSYNTKSKPKKKKRLDVEEGEISDSESEAIENIYGSLVVMDKDKKQGQVKPTEKTNQQRKIQICLVINADKEEESKPPFEMDLTETGVFENKNINVICLDSDASPSPTTKTEPTQSQKRENIDNSKDDKRDADKTTKKTNESNKSGAQADTSENKNDSALFTKCDGIIDDKNTEPNVVPNSPSKHKDSPNKTECSLPDKKQTAKKTKEPTKSIANFCKTQHKDVDKAQTGNISKTSDLALISNNTGDSTLTLSTKEQERNENKIDDSEIPLLNESALPPKAKKDVMSEIDILQALKNEILSETIPIAPTEVDTPALHQPKITKVASSTEAGTSGLQLKNVIAPGPLVKKRISIENYKKKSETVAKSLFVRNATRRKNKKQSLKLTEKECERFNFPVRLSLDDDTDDNISDDDLLDDDKTFSLDDIYGGLAPKSPDQDHFSDGLDETPVLIPTDPVKTTIATSIIDVDMRSLPILSQTPPLQTTTVLTNMATTDMSKINPGFESNKIVSDKNRTTLVDPRLRRDLISKDSPIPNAFISSNFEGTPRPTQFSNIPPLLGLNMTPIFTPSYAPSMTPIRTPNARSYEMTPSHQSFDIEEPQQKHVYAPSFAICDNRSNRDSPVANERPIWDPNKLPNSNDEHLSRRDSRNPRWEYSRGSSGQRDSQLNYNPKNDKFYVDKRDLYNKTDVPTTPGPSFGRADGSSTPRSSFPLLETPMTPSHPFGRSDCPSTPIHPFGRSDCPTTPIHPFGRSECPPTPNHPFGRSEPTSSHPFGRSDSKDPRLHRRQSDYESRNQHDERDRGYHNDRSYNRSNSYKSHSRPFSGSDSPRNYDCDQYVERTDRYSNEHGSRYSKNNVSDVRHFEQERRTDKNFSNESAFGFDRARREPSSNRSISREDNSRLFTKSRDGRYDSRYSENFDEIGSRQNQRERGIGKTMPGELIRDLSGAPGVSRSDYNNSLSVKSQAGRSFTIDTSVNATFQNLIESGKEIHVFDNTFDARRRRASSVGRSLVRESSVDRTLSHGAKSHQAQSSDYSFPQPRRNFQRASSVGRVLISDKNERSLKEIKADFKAFNNSLINLTKATRDKYDNTKKDVKKDAFRSNSSSRKDEFENQNRTVKQNSKQQYSPRKNCRDPRMRKQEKEPWKRNDRSSSHSWERRHSGIVYSSDNIAKGAIMGTGFGVKNYKIPKIKRPEPEQPKTSIEELVKEPEKINASSPKTDSVKTGKWSEKKDKDNKKHNEESENMRPSKSNSGKKIPLEKLQHKKDKSSDGDFKIKNKPSKEKDSKKVISSDDDSEVRVTRSSKKIDSNHEEIIPIRKAKQTRKAIIDDSDSESDAETTIKTKIVKPRNKSITKINKELMSFTQKTHDYEETKTKSIVIKESDGSVLKKGNTETEVASSAKDQKKTLEEDSLDSSFGIDLEIFSDNIVTDPVIDNINDLIADLDNDLNTAKSVNDSFSNEMENIMDAIDSQEENTLGDISELIEKDLNESNEILNQTINDDNILNKELELVTNPKQTTTPIVVAALTNNKIDSKNSVVATPEEMVPTIVSENVPDPKLISDVNMGQEKCTKKIEILGSNDETVSSTHIESNSNTKEDAGNIDAQKKIDQTATNSEHSTPDSTIVQNDEMPNKQEESLPDSTMEIHSEVSSDISSTLNDTEKISKETAEQSSSRKEVSAMESFGSLLSILQDKSKIKELLSMLGDQSGESEKLKKKLEKLSEIVSDDEDSNNDQLKDCNKSDKSSADSQLKEQITGETNDIQKHTENINLKQDASGEIEEKNYAPKTNDKENDTTPENNITKLDAPILEKENILKDFTDVIDQTDVDQICNDGLKDDQTKDEIESNIIPDEDGIAKVEKTVPKKIKVTKKGKGRGKRSKVIAKRANKASEVKVQSLKPKTQKFKTNRELQTLQNDIKEMFISEDVLNATGIRMCRLAKMVDNKTDKSPAKDESLASLQKSKSTESLDEPIKKLRKKPGPKPKLKVVNIESSQIGSPAKKSVGLADKIDNPKSSKPGPKSKTKQKHEVMDPYEFESDSVADTNTTKESDVNSSDSESDSLASASSSESSEVLADFKKKPKKKRGIWKTGVIKTRSKKKKEVERSPITTAPEVINRPLPLKPVIIPDMNCFTEKTYCFQRGVFTYDCRLCHYTGTEIVSHYKKQHAHTEVPLSRMAPDTAKKAIQQCEEVNIQAISKIPSGKYTCRFCYKEFSKNRVALETFFWHVVSTHTGEYKHVCYECINVTRCPFNLDIPPPPKEVKGQLIGYICGKCNFTQISLENLKTHVIVRHNDEQTEVYTINLGVMSQKAMKAMLRKSLCEEQKPRTLRSSRSNQNQSAIEASNDHSEISGSDCLSEVGSSTVPKIEDTDLDMDADLAKVKHKVKPGPMKSKLRFETDDQERSDEISVKCEETENETDYHETAQLDDSFVDQTHNETSVLDQTYNDTVHFEESVNRSSFIEKPFKPTVESDLNVEPSLQSGTDTMDNNVSTDQVLESRGATDVFIEPHFKLNYKETGAKEYVCCVNGEQNHYKTTLLISLKKHVQNKHSQKWDGYCCLCKVIVTLQGVQSSFKECLTHFLDKHMDDFPVIEKIVENPIEVSKSSLSSSIDASTIERTDSPRSYIAVRPMSDLILKNTDDFDPPLCEDSETPFPVIENIVSLGDKTVMVPKTSPVYPSTSAAVLLEPIPFQYEEVQAEVMSKKHRIVLDTMMPKEKLVRVFKCAGRYCSFTADSAEDALVHASAHKQLGGEGALDCAYCNFDAAENAIDLVMHVFKEHGKCNYSCVQCFYRAVADQLVGAHFAKAHGNLKTAKVLRATTAAVPTAADTTNMLSRDIAVSYYICNHGEGTCKFRTYTPGKFCEHMQQKHGVKTSHPCNLCDETAPTPADLVKHMKNHGMKLYQCTWCVHGENTETEMLSHAASMHPMKNPQAYLRIITNKDGSTDLRVLPLIYLNKLKVPVEEVTPSKVKENPTKEAERSIELEKLICHVNEAISQKTNDPKTPEGTEHIAEIPESSDMTDVQTAEAIEKSLLSSPEKAAPHVEEPPTSIKVEPDATNPSLNQRTEHVVYCLDSDEEEVAQNNTVDDSPKETVIDLSDDESPEKLEQGATIKQPSELKKVLAKSDKPVFKKLSVLVLFKCPSCRQSFSSVGGFKKHSNTCCLELTTFRCPHTPCPIVLSNITQLINHYNKDHNALYISKQYFCGICQSRWNNLSVTKKHLKVAHRVYKVVITSRLQDDGVCAFTVDAEQRPVTRELPKRKVSVEKTTKESSKKFGIDDIDKLPINPIMDSLVYCNICEFSTKVRLNMVRHLQLHAKKQPVPQTAPVNPVPHLETNEKHFDKMVNLASSSAATRVDKPPIVSPDAALRYPKYVSDRQRHTCGAKGCSYISVDEAMLRIHWETLHSGAVDYHCVHCPPHQHLDTTKLLTASRIIAHLKMHDAALYACSSCSYYHYKKQIVEKHIVDVHKDKSGHILIVREEGTNANVPQTGVGALGTMDLKPWQCGLCPYKIMLRQSVIEHCSKQHQTKMQYKCGYCPFRTSAVENITKHQSNAHAGWKEDVFYYYYREGTVPNEADGTPRWQKQSKKSGAQEVVKTEPDTTFQPLLHTVPIDLNLVKKEVDDNVELPIEDLYNQYGQLCEPNGISFRCPLCKSVSEYTRQAMQSHLYEELKYRRWSCALCSYKAFHRAGLNEHMASEHRGNFTEPSELPTNVNIEKWVSKLLDHQSSIIESNKVTSQPKMPVAVAVAVAVPVAVAGPSRVVESKKQIQVFSDSELEQEFGVFGTPQDDSYCCPKCKVTMKDEDEMRNHLESELSKIRWCCTKCTDKFPTFHEAQFHCKSHPGPLSRPKEAIRDPSLRSSWVSAVINTQKSLKPDLTQHHALQNIDLSDTSENSLLVVRYEEAAPTEEQLSELAREEQLRDMSRKRSVTPDSDDEDSMVIYEPESKKINDRNCPFCDFVSKSNHQYKLCMREHILRHYNLKVLTCSYCTYNGNRKSMYRHLHADHPGKLAVWKQTEIPNVLPSEFNLKSTRSNKKIEKRLEEELPKKVCLHCETSVPIDELITHIHGSKPSEFGDKGEVVVKCCICLTLRHTLSAMQTHYRETHPDITNLNYAYYKLQIDTRVVQSCGICNRRFTFLRDLRIHHSAIHGTFNFTYTTVPYRPDEDDHETRKRKISDYTPPMVKRIAKKSTSKLPCNFIAKKSTTKLPLLVDTDSESDGEYSYYGTRPSSFDNYENVKTMMPMYNTMVEIDVKKLSGIIKIDPKVVVKDCNGEF